MDDQLQAQTGAAQNNTAATSAASAAAPATSVLAGAGDTAPAQATQQQPPQDAPKSILAGVDDGTGQAQDGKQAADPAAKKDGDNKDAKPATKAPETYTEFKVPDGIVLDKATMDKFSPLAKELDLSQEQAQKLVDFESGRIKDLAAQYEAMKAQELADNIAQIKQNPKWQEEASYARRAVNKLADPDTQAFFMSTEMGSHPLVLRFLGAVGKMISEDRMPDGDQSTHEEVAPWFTSAKR